MDRYSHTAALLPSGKVLIAGGYNYLLGGVATAEIYDPATQAFTPTANMSVERFRYASAVLANGKVLMTGGYYNRAVFYLASAELYDPASGNFTQTGSMSTDRA